MSTGGDKPAIWVAGEAREYLRGALEDKPREYVREFAGLVDDPETLDLLNNYCSLYEQFGDVNFLDTPLADHIIRSASTQMLDRAFRAGNVSQMKGVVGLTKRDEKGEEAVMEAARLLSNEGAIYLTLGPPGSGKTSFTLDAARVYGAITGGTIISNIDWEGADELVTDSKTMLDVMASEPGPVLMVIDEADQSLTSRGAEQAVTNALAKDFKLIRKKLDGDDFAKKGSIALIGQSEMGTAAEIRRLASGAYVKPNQDDPGHVVFKKSEGGKDTLEQVNSFRGVTDTREDYDEHSAHRFEVVMETASDDEEDQDDPEDVERQEAVRTALRAVVVQGQSYEDAADLIPWGDSWVGNRFREWRDKGEYRGLLALDDVPPGAVPELEETD